MRSVTLALLVGAALAACDSPTGGRTAGALSVEMAGNEQTGTVGAPLGTWLVVRVLDERRRPVADQVVTFRVTSGGGRVSEGTIRTSENGEAFETWTLGTVAADSQRVEVRMLAPSGGEQVFGVFRAVARADTAATVGPEGSLARSGPAGGAVADSLAVRVFDRFLNPVPGATVVWAVPEGSGSISPLVSKAGADGVARAQWTLGTALNAVQTASGGLSGGGARRLGFTGQASLPAGSLLEASAGDRQTGAVGTQLPGALVVSVRLSDGRPVQGAQVAWAGSGTLAPAASVTDANGTATARWTLPTTPGAATAGATVSGGTLTFTSTAVAGPPARIVLLGGQGQADTVGRALPTDLAFRLEDRYSNPVSGAEVQWKVISGGGSVAPATARADASGGVRARWTLGPVPGVQEVHLAASDLVYPVAARAYHGSVARIVIDQRSLTTPPVNAFTMTAKAYDRYDNYISDAAPDGPGLTFPFDWLSLDPAVVRVAPFNRGVFFPDAVGTARIVARSRNTAVADTVVVVVK